MEDEIKKKLFNDELFTHKTDFDYDYFIKHLEVLSNDLPKLRHFEFLVCMWELTKIFNQLGKSLSMAFSDITEKVNIWRSLYKNNYPNHSDLQSVIEEEIKLGIQELNGENNKKKGHKKGVSIYHDYVSGARTLLRLIWFLDFMVNILKLLLNTNDGFSTCCKNAYDKALGIYHPWYVRSAATLALSFASSSRKPVLKILFGSENWDDDAIKKIDLMQKYLEKVFTTVNKLYEEKNLHGLP